MNLDKLKKIFFKEFKEPDYNFLRSLPESEYEFWLKKIYRARTGLNLNLNKPKRFNEKIQYLKLNDNMEEKYIYADKILVRDYYIKKIGNNSRLKEFIGIYNSFDEIDFSTLPDNFFMQANHGSKMILKIKNKPLFLEKGLKGAEKMFDGWLNYNFAYCAGFEMQYKNIKPKIIIEKLYENDDNSRARNFMFFCCNGKPVFVQSVFHINQLKIDGAAFYDLNWKIYPDCCFDNTVYYKEEKPMYFEEMLEITKKLSSDFKFVRVDFMEINSGFYFLELTFTPNSGFVRFKPDKYDFYFGKFLKL